MQRLIVALFGLLLAACSSSLPETPPTRVVIWLHAASNLNPSATGQAAPLRLRLYELKKDTAFGRTDYFALTDNAQSTLGGDLVEQDEFLLRPGEERRIERTFDEQARQLGFVAVYRNLDHATWRQVLDVPGQRTSHLDITLGAQATGIVARPAPRTFGVPMSWNSRVARSEGMFLRLQYFQQHDRYLETLVDGRCRSLLAGGWDFSEPKPDDALLTQGKLAIVGARDVLPDGMPLNIPTDDPAPAPPNVGESLRDGIVYLGLPLERVGARDTVEEGETLGGARYVSQVQEVRDDSAAFESRAPVALGSQVFCLPTERDDLGEYAAVGVAWVREKRADQALGLDEGYLPPVLDIAAAPSLVSFARELLGLLRQHGEALAGRVVASSAGDASEIADFLLLQLVNRAEALTGHLSRVRPLHPQELYRELVALTGEFCTFTASQRRPEEYPVYNHDDPAASFAPVMLALCQALATVIDAKAIAIPIVEKAYGVHVTILSDCSLIDNASFVLVVHTDVPGESPRGHFSQQTKVGSVEHIRDLVNLQLPGIGLLPMPVAPRQIPYHAGSIYFELDRGNAHWKQLTHFDGSAFHIAGQFPRLNLAFWAIQG